jgi:nucleoside-diphosphate-sugar epimerase
MGQQRMKLLVTGVSGRLGQAIALEAQRQGISLVGIDLKPWPADVEQPSCLEFHRVPLEDTATIDRLLVGCDGLINAAGLHGENIEGSTLEAFIRANVADVARLLDLAHKRGVKCAALSSTMQVLIGRSHKACGLTILDECSPVQCDTSYATSKLLMEQLGRYFALQTGMSVSSLRYMAFGYKSERRGGPTLLSRLLPSQDAARAAILAATTPGLAGEVFNIGPATPLTLDDVPAAIVDPVGTIEKYFPGASKVLQRLDFTVEPADILPATRIDKARRLLGWHPLLTFEEWLARSGQQLRGPESDSSADLNSVTAEPRMALDRRAD